MTYDILLLAEIVKAAPDLCEAIGNPDNRGLSSSGFDFVDKWWYNHDSGKLHKLKNRQDHHIDFAYKNPHKLHLDHEQREANNEIVHNEHDEEFPQIPHPLVLQNNTRVTKVGGDYELHHFNEHPKYLDHAKDILTKLNAPLTADVTHAFGDISGRVIPTTAMDTMHARSFKELDANDPSNRFSKFRHEEESVRNDDIKIDPIQSLLQETNQFLAEDQAEYSYYDHPEGIKWERGRFHHSSLRDYYDIPTTTPRGHFVVDHKKRSTKVLPYYTHGSTVNVDDIHSRLRSEFHIPSFYSR